MRQLTIKYAFESLSERRGSFCMQINDNSTAFCKYSAFPVFRYRISEKVTEKFIHSPTKRRGDIGYTKGNQ